jgi:hypothetical protein
LCCSNPESLLAAMIDLVDSQECLFCMHSVCISASRQDCMLSVVVLVANAAKFTKY